MTRHPRYPHTLEDPFLKVFVLLDDWLIATPQRFALPQQSNVVGSGNALEALYRWGHTPVHSVYVAGG